MNRRIQNHEILDRGSGELNFLKIFKDTGKTIAPCETGQNLLPTAPILTSHTIPSNRDITIETSVLKISMTLPLKSTKK